MSLSDSSQSPGPTPLQYSQRRPLRFFSRHPRLLVLASLCIAMGVSWYLWRTPLQYRIRWYYWTRQAMNYQMPATSQDVRIKDQVRAKTMPAANPDYVLIQSPNRADAVFVPKAYRALSDLAPKIRTIGIDYNGLTFIGTLMRPDGTPRLVIIPGSEWVRIYSPNAGIGYSIVKRSGLFDPMPAKIVVVNARVTIGGNAGGYQTKTAIRDAADPTHVIIPLNSNGERSPYQLDAYLLDDDTLSISVNNAAPRPTTAGDTFIEMRTSIVLTTKGSASLGFTQSNPGLIRPPTTKPTTLGIR